MYGLYVHVPFCERKCKYCSFYSIVNRNLNREVDIYAYLDALELEAQKYNHERLRTLYFGGGTPSVLSLSQWHRLIGIIDSHFDTSGLIEATVEANPNSITREHISFWKDNHITRISLGVQSMNDDELSTLGRIHDSRQALRAMELVRDSGMDLSCDLIFAIPGQTLRTWDNSLRTVMRYASHISTYQLTLEENTPLAHELGHVDLNSQGYMFYRYAQYMLPKNNFVQYEISNFARGNHECIHNMSYWDHSNVIALGPSAVGYIDGVRLMNSRTLEEYISGGEVMREELSAHERGIELAILSLRTKWGISRTNLLPEIEHALELMPDDLFIKTPERISLSKRGMRLGNSIWCELIDL